jgi:hypothetical protein
MQVFTYLFDVGAGDVLCKCNVLKQRILEQNTTMPCSGDR